MGSALPPGKGGVWWCVSVRVCIRAAATEREGEGGHLYFWHDHINQSPLLCLMGSERFSNVPAVYSVGGERRMNDVVPNGRLEMLAIANPRDGMMPFPL
jgi:hypothetical protein